jgi:hypothetical protein
MTGRDDQQQNHDGADPGGVTAPSSLPGQAGRELPEVFQLTYGGDRVGRC